MALVALINIIVKPSDKTNKILIVIFGIFWLLLFGFRDFEVGSDTRAYLYSYNEFLFSNDTLNFENSKDLGYFFYMIIISQFSLSERLFIFFFDFLYLFPVIYFFQKIKTEHVFLLFFSFCSFFFFKTMGINIMRQGVGVSFFLLGMYYFFENRKKNAYLFFFIGFLFHGSLITAILAIILSKKIKSLKIPLAIYIVSMIVSYIGFDFNSLFSKIPIISFLFQERLSSLIEYDENDYQTGFRLSFVIFNSLFALIAIYFYKKGIVKLIPYYNNILYFYLILSGLFFIMFSLPFSDRTGIMSWIVIPILLMPLLKMKNIELSMLKLYFLNIFIFIYFNI